MKLYICFLLVFVGKNAFTQDISLQQRIKEVENNLMPYVSVKGFTGWNIEDRMKYYQVPGLSIAVIKDFRIDWMKAYGLADTIKKTAVTTETMFSAGSISKFVMAITALKLVEESKISLDSPINHYLRSWKIPENEFTQKTPITLRMLLSHKAGTSQTSYFGFTPDQTPFPSIIQILRGDKIAESRGVVVNSDPNKEFRYSGGGSMIAQMALMDITGKSFADLTQQILFDRLTMHNSTFEQPVPVKYTGKTSGAYSAASWFKGVPYVYPQQAAAGLYTTPTDLANLFIDVQKSYRGEGKILSQATVKKMLTPQVKVSDGGYREEMGIGPFLIQRTDNKDPKGIYFEFTGVNAGFLAYGIASMEGGNGVIIMLNSGDDQNGIGKEIRRSVAKTYHWVNYLPEEIQPIQLPEDTLEKLTGRYRMGVNEVLYLRREKNYLVENINEGKDIYCFPITKDSIVFTDFNVKGYFKFNDKGEAISLQSVWQEKAMPKMKAHEFSPNEYLQQKIYIKAKAAFKAMNLNEYQLTYIAYDLLNKKKFDPEAVKTILEVAVEQHPNSPVVYSRWGDYYIKLNEKKTAIQNYQKALELDPSDEQTKKLVESLQQ